MKNAFDAVLICSIMQRMTMKYTTCRGYDAVAVNVLSRGVASLED